MATPTPLDELDVIGLAEDGGTIRIRYRHHRALGRGGRHLVPEGQSQVLLLLHAEAAGDAKVLLHPLGVRRFGALTPAGHVPAQPANQLVR